MVAPGVTDQAAIRRLLLRWLSRAVIPSLVLGIAAFDGGFVPAVTALVACVAALGSSIANLARGVQGRREPILQILLLIVLGWVAIRVGRGLYSTELLARVDQFQKLADRLADELDEGGGERVSEERPIRRIQFAIAERESRSGPVHVTLVVGSYFGNGLVLRRGLMRFGGGHPPTSGDWCYKPLKDGWYQYFGCH